MVSEVCHTNIYLLHQFYEQTQMLLVPVRQDDVVSFFSLDFLSFQLFVSYFALVSQLAEAHIFVLSSRKYLQN